MQTNQLLKGLSTQEVEERRSSGKGTIPPPSTGRSYFQIIRQDVFTLINNILFVLCLTLILLGQVSEAFISVGTVLFNVVVSVIQEVRAKRTLDHIALLTRPKATVLRDGQQQNIDPGQLVQDDVLLLSAGDQVVADGPMIAGQRLEVDESQLTGESNLVVKQVGDTLYSGSFCVTGSAHYRAEKLGIESVAGRITAGARAYRRAYTPLQRQINLIMQSLLLAALYLETIFIITSLVSGTPFVDTVRISIIIVGIVPIGLLLASSVAYALGALRIADKNILVQHLSAVESLSNIDVLCLDKTGTLTSNNLLVEKVQPYGRDDETFRRFLAQFVSHTSSRNGTSQAILKACAEPEDSQNLRVREEIPFSSALKWSALAIDDERMRGIYALGAPEMLSFHIRIPTDNAALAATQSVSQSDQNYLQEGDLGDFATVETERGMRVLLFAYSPDLVPLRNEENAPTLPHDMIPLGMISLSDELRPNARETLSDFAKLGIRIKIISGDNPRTVSALAKQVGIPQSEKIISGLDLENLSDTQFIQVAKETTVFGRITPQQKERLVQTLRDDKQYVAMIGDGVNDVLSLKQANLGIAMNSGSQATRGVADMVLLNDSFATLPFAFGEGQRVRNGMYNVLKIFMSRVLYLTLLLVTIPIVGGFPFEPKQRSIITFITASIMTVALAAWAQPGPPPKRGLWRELLHFAVPAALTQSLFMFCVYVITIIMTLTQQPNIPEIQLIRTAQTSLTAFAVFSGLLLVPFAVPPLHFLTGGSKFSGDWRPTLLAIGMLVVFVIILAIPPFSHFFSLMALPPVHYLFVAGAALLWGIILRWLWRFNVLERFLQLDT